MTFEDRFVTVPTCYNITRGFQEIAGESKADRRSPDQYVLLEMEAELSPCLDYPAFPPLSCLSRSTI